ncbi:MAG: hypothetical protein KME67_03930 [Candidatus Thiodiazotropha sp. (ex Codakia orbicularis)]|nr:hypothetical protein [Candidatus Thiodiazotropha sp. (ex Codakia orbicularis)]
MNSFNPNAFFQGMFAGAGGGTVSSGAHGDITVGGPVRFANTGGGVDNTTLMIAGAAFLAFVYLVK